jgi:hypothetical protein
MKDYFKVTEAEVLAAVETENTCFDFLKSDTENGIHCAIGYNRIETRGGINPADDMADVYVFSDMGYMCEKNFYGADALKKAVNFANKRLNSNYL